MSNIETVAVIGGTGKIGKYVVDSLLKRGYKVKMLYRNPEKISEQHKLTELIKGDATDYQSISKLLRGSDALISTLGQDLRSTPMFEKATNNIIKAINVQNIQRYIMVAGIGISIDTDNKNWKMRTTSRLMKFLFSGTINDKQTAFEILKKSDINWTVIRVPMVKFSDKQTKITTNLTDCTGSKIYVSQLSDFMVKQLSDNTFLRKSPFLFVS